MTMIETSIAIIIKQTFGRPTADLSADAYAREVKKDFAERVSNMFKHNNPNFDVDEFMRSCND